MLAILRWVHNVLVHQKQGESFARNPYRMVAVRYHSSAKAEPTMKDKSPPPTYMHTVPLYMVNYISATDTNYYIYTLVAKLPDMEGVCVHNMDLCLN